MDAHLVSIGEYGRHRDLDKGRRWSGEQENTLEWITGEHTGDNTGGKNRRDTGE